MVPPHSCSLSSDIQVRRKLRFAGVTMEEMILGLGAILFTVIVVAVVVYGLWLTAVSVWRAVRSTLSHSSTGMRCQVCHHPHGVVGDRCRHCGAPLQPSDDSQHRSDLVATRRQLNRWMEQGKLDLQSHQTFLQLLDAELSNQDLAQSDIAFAPVSSIPAVSPFPPATCSSDPAVPADVSPYLAISSAEEEIAEAELVPEEIVSIHPLERVADVTPAAPKHSVSRRAFADVLQAFMEQKNIRWVELISGLLVVGGATGLVISLRAALKDKIPYFPAISFFLITAAFHAAGIYSLRRWNLKSTSRGVLIIATLLVPLSILAAIFLSGEGEQQRAVTDPVFLLAATVGVFGFGTMNYFASRALVRHGWWRMMLAVLGPSYGQLLVNRGQVSHSGPVHAALLMLLPVGSFLVANGASMARFRRRPHVGRRPIQQFFLELGIAAFSILAPIGLFLAKAESAAEGLRSLSPLLSLVVAATLAAGLFAHRRVVQPDLIAYRTTGTGLAILSAGFMLLMVGFAWPQLDLLMAVGLLNFAILSFLAVIGDLALLHVLAVGCLALAYLAGFQLWRGLPVVTATSPQLMQAMISGVSGAALTLFATASALAGMGLLRKRRDTGLAYLAASAGLGLACVAIAAYAGFWSGPATGGNWATAILIYFAIAALVAARVIGRAEASWFGSALVLAAAIHGLRLNTWLREPLRSVDWLLYRPVLAAVLVHAMSTASGAALVTWLVVRRNASAASRLFDFSVKIGDRPPDTLNKSLIDPLAWSALAATVLAIPSSLRVLDERFGVHAIYLACAALVWLLVLFVHRLPWLWSGFQILTTLALAYFGTWIGAQQAWWSGELRDARHIHLQIAVLGLSCIGWTTLRRFTQGRRERFDLPPDDRPTVDRFLVMLLSLVVVMTAVIGCIPGLQNELAAAGLQSENAETAAVLRLLSGGAWLALAIVLAALGFAIWEQRSISMLLTIVLTSVSVPFFVAGQFFDANATASAARWGMALFAAAWFVPACFFGGWGKSGTNWRLDLPQVTRPADAMRVLSVFLSLLTVLGMTTAVLLRVSAGEPVGIPVAENFFGRIGSATSYSVPLAGLMIVLLAYAVREAKVHYAFSASLVFQYFVSLACLLPSLTAGVAMDAPLWAKLLQWNGVALAAFTLVWMSLRRWIEPGSATRPCRLSNEPWLATQVVLMLTAICCFAAWITGAVWSDATRTLPAVLVLGHWPSYLAIALAVAAGWRLSREDPPEWGTHFWHGAVLVLVPVMAATAHRYRAPADAWAYHFLVVGWLGLAALAAGWMSWRMRDIPLTAKRCFSPSTMAGMLWGTFALVLAALSAWTNIERVPTRIPEMFAAWGAIVVLGTLAVRLRLAPYSYASIACGGIATVLLRMDLPVGHPLKSGAGAFPQLSFSILGIAGVWLVWDVWFQRRGADGLSQTGRGAAHRFTARFAIAVALLLIGFLSLHLVVNGRPIELDPAELTAFVLAFLAFFALQFGSLWDRRGYYATFGLYVWILSVGLFIVDMLPLSPQARPVAWIATMAAQIAVTGWIWSWGGKLATMGRRLGMVDPIESLRRTARWLTATNLILAAEVLIASTWVVLSMQSRELRVAAGCLPLFGAIGIAGIAQQHRRTALQLTALLTVSWGVVLLGWSDIVPVWSLPTMLARAIRSLMALGTMGFVFGVIAVRVTAFANEWRESARRSAVVLAAGALSTLVGILALEATTFVPGVGAPVTAPQIAAVSLVLIALIATLISLAVLPGRDPLALTDKGRMLYVYGAQAVAVILFAHMYLAMPGLFQGTLRPYWPYIILVLAFAGVGVGTLFDRLQLPVLAEPFRRSGAFLPLVPAIGMWLADSDSSYTAVLFVIGVLYVLLSFTQRSPLARAAAAVAGNGALWSLLSGQGNLAFSEHPQFWLIPPAVSAMIAAQLNRQRLTEMQLATVRYIAMGVIYLSSAIEMLKIGIGESLWPPVILICLALAGIVFGIAMRVRAYLYLGSVFVLVSLVSMVAHASRSIHHVWPWWAFVIAMGMLILVVFGYFEGRRTQMIALIERLRQWEK